MSEILQLVTPKWEEEELVWARKNKTNQGGGGYIYVSIRTSKSITGNYRGKTASDPIMAPLTDDLNAAALFMLSSVFVYERNTAAWMDTAKDMRDDLFVDAEKDWTLWTEFEGALPPAQNDESNVGTDIYEVPEDTDPCDIPDPAKKIAIKTVTVGDQVKSFLDKLVIDDKNIAFPSCFKSAILLKISFTDFISLLDFKSQDNNKLPYANFEKTEIRSDLESLLGLLKPKPPVDDNCCECVDEPGPPPAPPKPERPINSPQPGWSTKTYQWCCGPFQGEGIPPAQRLFSGCTWMPSLKENDYLTQTEKDKEDELFKLGCHIRTCAQTETKGKVDFVGNEIGPPSFEKPGPCGDVDSIESMQQALDYVVTPFGVKGLIKKAAKCVGVDLSLEDLKEMIIMAAIENLDCSQIIKLINKVQQLTGVDVRSTPKFVGYLGQVVGPILDKLPAKEIRKIAIRFDLNPKFIGDIEAKDINACMVITAKMPQEIKQIAAHLAGLPGEQIVEFLFDFNLAEQALLSACEKHKKEIIGLLREVLDRVNLDDLSLPGEININLELPNLISALSNIDFSFLDVDFGSFSILLPNIELPTIDWRKLADIDFSKLAIIFKALDQIQWSKIKDIDFNVDIDFDFLANISYDQLADAFEKLSKINFNAPIPDLSAILAIVPQIADIDLSKLANTIKLLGNIDFEDIVKSLGGAIGNIADKFEKVVKDALNYDLSKNVAEFLNDFEINPPNLLPELPTINLPDLLPTTDFMASFANGIAEGITEALTQAVVSMIKSVLKAVCQACDQGNVGDLDIGATIAESAKSSFTPAKVKEAQENVIGELKKMTPTDISTTKAAQMLDSLIDDVSTILKPGEVSNLLLGKSSPDITEAIECLVQQKPGYAEIAPALEGNAQINKLFASIGELADRELLLAQVADLTKPKKRNSDQPFLPGCETGQEEQDREALVEMGINDPDEIEKQLDNARERKKKKFKELADLWSKPNVLDGVIPEAQCNISATEKNKPGLMPEEPPAMKAMQKMTIDTLYDGVYMSFNQDIARFPEAIGVQIEVPKSIPRTLTSTDDEGDEVVYINPEIRRLVSDGVMIPEFEIDDDGDDQEGNPPFLTKVPSLQIAPELKGYLNDFENNPELFSAGTIPAGGQEDQARGLYRLMIPNKTGIEKANVDFLNSFKDPTTGKPLVSPGIQNQVKDALKESEFRIHYDIYNSPDIDKENYRIKIESYVSSSRGEVIETLFSASTFPSGAAMAQPASAYLTSDPGALKHAPYNPVDDFTIFLEERFQEGVGGGTLPVITELQHDEIFNDIIASISKQCARSDFFDPKTLKLVEFTPQLTEKQKACGCIDPHLLDLEELKKKVMEEYEEERCADDSFPNEDSSGGGATVGPLESAAIAGVVQTVIRLYLIDLTLRAIFVLSEFPVSDPGTFNTYLDSLIQSYYTKSMIDDLVKRDKAYAVEFQRQAILYHNKIAEKNGWEKTQDAALAIGNLISLQLGSVTLRLTQTLGKNWGGYNINQILAEHWLPLYDLPQQKYDQAIHVPASPPRFGEMGFSFSEAPGAQFKVIRDVKERLDAQIPKLDPAQNSISATTAAILNLRNVPQWDSGSAVFKGETFDPLDSDSIQQKYWNPALESLARITGRVNGQLQPSQDSADHNGRPIKPAPTAWDQWPLLAPNALGPLWYPENSTNYKTKVPVYSTVQDLTFEQIQEINLNKREVYHFKNWSSTADYTGRGVASAESNFYAGKAEETRIRELTHNSASFPTYWNDPIIIPESRVRGIVLASSYPYSRGFDNRKLTELITGLRKEINYYKAHMLREPEGESPEGRDDEVHPNLINGGAQVYDFLIESEGNDSIIAMRGHGGDLDPADENKILQWAKEEYKRRTNNPKVRLEGYLFAVEASNIFVNGSSWWTIDADEFAYNFLQQQLRFASRIFSYEALVGRYSGTKISDLWSTPPEIFSGVVEVEHNKEFHEFQDEDTRRGTLELASHIMTETLNKKVLLYGGPPGGLNMLSNIEKFSTVGDTDADNHGSTTFKLDNGNLILERYIKKMPEMDTALGYDVESNDWRKGKVSLETFREIIKNQRDVQGRDAPVPEDWLDTKLGIRMTYVPPLSPRDFDDPTDIQNIPQTNAVILEKAYNLIEHLDVPEAYAQGRLEGKDKNISTDLTVNPPVTTTDSIKAQRRVFPIPLFEAEIEPFKKDNGDPKYPTLDSLFGSDGMFPLNPSAFVVTDLPDSPLWRDNNGALITALINKPEFKFLFDYCFPLKRMVFLMMLYNMIYFSFDKEVTNLFNNTKEALKQTFYTLLNAGDYTYKDKTTQKIGGNKGLMTAMENGDDIPGIDLLGIIARTPLLILKGLAEQTDPNIGIAKKIHDGAIMGDVDLPMVVCSILGLPMNIIPPPPIGPGIGPPIGPLGFAYLALDAGSSLLSADEKKLKKSNAKKEKKLDLDQAKNASDCPET